MENKIKDLINSIVRGHCTKVTIIDEMFMSWKAELRNGEIAYRHNFVNWFGAGGTFQKQYEEIIYNR